MSTSLNGTICIRQNKRPAIILNRFDFIERKKWKKECLKPVRIEFYEHLTPDDRDHRNAPQLLQNSNNFILILEIYLWLWKCLGMSFGVRKRPHCKHIDTESCFYSLHLLRASCSFTQSCKILSFLQSLNFIPVSSDFFLPRKQFKQCRKLSNVKHTTCVTVSFLSDNLCGISTFV